MTGVDMAKELLHTDQKIVSVKDRNGAGTEYRVSGCFLVSCVNLCVVLIHFIHIKMELALHSELLFGWSNVWMSML